MIVSDSDAAYIHMQNASPHNRPRVIFSLRKLVYQHGMRLACVWGDYNSSLVDDVFTHTVASLVATVAVKDNADQWQPQNDSANPFIISCTKALYSVTVLFIRPSVCLSVRLSRALCCNRLSFIECFYRLFASSFLIFKSEEVCVSTLSRVKCDPEWTLYSDTLVTLYQYLYSFEASRLTGTQNGAVA